MSVEIPSDRILVVDDEQRLLDSLKRAHRKVLDLTTALGPEEGLKAVRQGGPFAVVVSDQNMPGMLGTAFLGKVRELSPDSVRVMLTGNSDIQTAMDAVNEGNVFRFLRKPCEAKDFQGCIEAALEMYRLRQAERLLLEHTLKGAIEVLAEVLALTNPVAFGRAKRIQTYVRQIVKLMNLRHAWQYETAALLSQVGCVSVPPEVLDRAAAGAPLEESERAMIDRHPDVARDLLTRIPRLEGVAAIVAGLRDPRSQDAPAGSRVIAFAQEFDDLVAYGRSPADVSREMIAGKAHDRRLLDLLDKLKIPGQSSESRMVSVSELCEGMVIVDEVFNNAGQKLVGGGTEVTASLLARLQNYSALGRVREPFLARTQVAAAAA